MSVSGGTERGNSEVVEVATGEISSGDTVGADGSEAVPLPFSARDNRVFRIHSIEDASATYGNSNVVSNARMAIGPQDAIEDFQHSNVYENQFGRLLYWQEANINTDAADFIEFQRYAPLSGDETFVDYPFGSLHWTASNGMNSTIHYWNSVMFHGEVVEVSDDYNLDLLREAVDEFL